MHPAPPLGSPAQAQGRSALRLPLLFIVTGIILFFVFHGLALCSLGRWLTEHPRHGPVLAHVHLLVLGWGTMIAMGAVYQLIQVVVQSPLYSRRLGYVHYAVFTLGLIGLAIGFRLAAAPWIAGFAVLVLAGIGLFVWNLSMTLWKAGQWDAVTLSTVSAVVYLWLAALAGAAMGVDFAFGWLGEFHHRLFGVHIWLGLAGWFGLLITGYSCKLLPMFLLAHGFSTVLPKIVVCFWNLGVIGGAVAFLAAAPGWMLWLSAAWIALAVAVFAVHVGEIQRHSYKKRAGGGVMFAVFLTKWFALCAVVGVLTAPLIWGTAWQEKLAVMTVWGYLWGWAAMTILAYLSKIVPFLWWTYKYGPRAGKEPVPQLSDLLHERRANSGLYAIGVAFLAVLLGIGMGHAVLAAAAGVALSLFSLWYMSLIALVFAK